MKKRELTAEDREALDRLRNKWSEWQRRRREKGQKHSQQFAGLEMGMTQGAVSQYINGTIPLGVEAALKFARLFSCYPQDIRPDLSFEIRSESPDQGSSPRIRILIDHFESLTGAQQDEFLRDLAETKQRNEALLEELIHRRKAS